MRQVGSRLPELTHNVLPHPSRAARCLQFIAQQITCRRQLRDAPSEGTDCIPAICIVLSQLGLSSGPGLSGIHRRRHGAR